MELYQGGEVLFKLPVTDYPEIAVTQKELIMSEQVFGLFTDVSNSIETWKQLTWAQVTSTPTLTLPLTLTQLHGDLKAAHLGPGTHTTSHP